MSFKDQVAADMAVFLNPKEFGEEHSIDGKTVICVVDRQMTPVPDNMGGVIFLETVKIAVRASDLVIRPGQGKILRFDGQPYKVLGAPENMGMLAVTITRETSA